MSSYWSSPRWLQRLVAIALPAKKTWRLTCTRQFMGSWTFDVKPFIYDEPLVNGTDRVVDHYYHQLTGRQPIEGDRVLLTVSTKPLKDSTTTLSFEKADDLGYNGNLYVDKNTELNCWLCGVNQVLFGRVPDTIYVKVKPLEPDNKNDY